MVRNPRISKARVSSVDRTIRLVRRICRAAGRPTLIDDSRVALARHCVIAAVQRHGTPAIFNWLIDALSYQGVSDSIAYSYMEQHGRVRWQYINAALREQPHCENLKGYWLFEHCNNRKSTDSCAHPEHRTYCPLPRHDLRNGRLNQTAYAISPMAI
jgi:hypothetical protein